MTVSGIAAIYLQLRAIQLSDILQTEIAGLAARNNTKTTRDALAAFVEHEEADIEEAGKQTCRGPRCRGVTLP